MKKFEVMYYVGYTEKRAMFAAHNFNEVWEIINEQEKNRSCLDTIAIAWWECKGYYTE